MALSQLQPLRVLASVAFLVFIWSGHPFPPGPPSWGIGLAWGFILGLGKALLLEAFHKLFWMHEWLNKKAWECLVNSKTLAKCELTSPPSLMWKDVLVPEWLWPWRFGEDGKCLFVWLPLYLCFCPLHLSPWKVSTPGCTSSASSWLLWSILVQRWRDFQRTGMLCLFFTTSSWISISFNPLHLILTISVQVFIWRNLSQTPFFLPEPQTPPWSFPDTVWAPFLS